MKYLSLFLFFILYREVKSNCWYHQSSYNSQAHCESQGLTWLTPPTHPDGNCYTDISHINPTFDDCCVGYADDCASGNQAVWVGAACTVGPGGGACQNGGTAVGNDPYCTCTCTADYMGDNCETLRGCHPTGQAESFVVSDTGSPVPDTDPLYVTSAAECQAASDTYIAAGGSVQQSAIGNYPWHETPEGCVAQVNSNTGQISRFYWNECASESNNCVSQNIQVCDNSDAGGNIWKCVRRVCTNLAPDPDFYEPSDAEPDPLPDGDWETQDVACGEGNFVSLATNGEFSCKSCTQAGQGKTAFLAEFNKKRGAGEGSGVYHGKCCVNGHHKVCQQLLKSYKQNCDDSDKGQTSNRECVAV